MDSIDETDQEKQEREHFQKIVRIFKSYKYLTEQSLDNKQSFMKGFPADQQKLLESYSSHLDELKVCVQHNYEIIKLIIKDVESMFENVQHDDDKMSPKVKPIMSSDLDKVYTTFRQIVRDWSAVGANERSQCYTPILEAIDKRFPKDKIERSNINVLVPGAGLGRLSYELANRGYACQGNEFSLFMLFASNFVLNRCSIVDSLKIYPFAHSHCNVISHDDQMKGVTFPDVNPSSLPSSSQLTMAAGDFLEIYTEANTWDCVATCFFIDCANNIVDFIQTIYKILKPGGVWVNLGPLLYHFADQVDQLSIEPSYQHLIEIIKKTGFIVSEEQTNVKTTYTQNTDSMLKYEYSSVFFVATKP